MQLVDSNFLSESPKNPPLKNCNCLLNCLNQVGTAKLLGVGPKTAEQKAIEAVEKERKRREKRCFRLLHWARLHNILNLHYTSSWWLSLSIFLSLSLSLYLSIYLSIYLSLSLIRFQKEREAAEKAKQEREAVLQQQTKPKRDPIRDGPARPERPVIDDESTRLIQLLREGNKNVRTNEQPFLPSEWIGIKIEILHCLRHYIFWLFRCLPAHRCQYIIQRVKLLWSPDLIVYYVRACVCTGLFVRRKLEAVRGDQRLNWCRWAGMDGAKGADRIRTKAAAAKEVKIPRSSMSKLYGMVIKSFYIHINIVWPL